MKKMSHPTSFINICNHDRLTTTLTYTPKDDPLNAMTFTLHEETHLIGGRKYRVDVSYEDYSATITEIFQDEI